MNLNGTECTTIPTTAFGLWYTIMEGIIGFLAVFGNGFVVFLIATKRNLQINPNYFILSLALADLFLGLTLPTFSILCSTVMDCDWIAFYKFWNFFSEASVANLCLMTFDRYLAINFPLWYISNMSRTYLGVSIAIAWIFPAFFAMLPFLWQYNKDTAYVKRSDDAYYLTLLIIFEVIPVITMPIIYLRIFTVVRRHSRQVSKQREQVSYNKNARIDEMENGNGTNEREGRTPYGSIATNMNHNGKLEVNNAEFEEKSSNCNSKKEQKKQPSLLEREGSSSTLVLGLVIFLFVLCWSYDIYITLCTRVHLSICSVNSHNEEAIVNLLIYLNSTVNPFVYFLFKKDVRRELKACLKRN